MQNLQLGTEILLDKKYLSSSYRRRKRFQFFQEHTNQNMRKVDEHIDH